MQHQEGNNVNTIKEVRVTSVPIQRTQPVERKKILENITEEEEDNQKEEVEIEAEREEVIKNTTEGRDNSEEEKEAEAKGKEDDRQDEVATGEPRPKKRVKNCIQSKC